MPYSGRTSRSSPRRRADGTPPRSFAGSEPGERHRAELVPRTRRCRSNGAWIGWTGKTYDYFLYVASTLPLRSRRVRRQHSPLSLLCITMILRVRRKFFEITTFPNKKNMAWVPKGIIHNKNDVHASIATSTIKVKKEKNGSNKQLGRRCGSQHQNLRLAHHPFSSTIPLLP